MTHQCIDCPDLPNGVRKRAICCRREGALTTQPEPIKPRRRRKGKPGDVIHPVDVPAEALVRTG